jgi:hypothetical protein
MNFFKTAKLSLLTGFAAVALMTQPILAHAEEIVTDPGDSDPVAAINHGVTVLAWARVDGVSPAGDDVITDGIIITAENVDAANDNEWKYVNVRRTADTSKDAFFVRNDATTVAQ